MKHDFVRDGSGFSWMAAFVVAGLFLSPTAAASADYPITPCALTNAVVTGGFWSAPLEKNRLVTIPSDFRKCEESGRIANFERAGRRELGHFHGIPFDDSDVYKVIEGASYELAARPDSALDASLDALIAKIAAAQEPDGYLYTARTQGITNDMAGATRWCNLEGSHELYNLGHLYEAAAAHSAATGKRSLLAVAVKSADLVDRTFGPAAGQLHAVPGHEEIEIGLGKLYRATGEPRYLRLAKYFLDMRGRADRGTKLYGPYSQDHRPVTDQAEAVGHAVRAGYLYCGMADVAALAGDPAYGRAIDRIWQDVVGSKLHLNGGIGARHEGEAFGAAYELPNETAYLETCAAIANALWNERMFLLTGESKYIDVLERVLYNGFLSGVSLSGDEFFYPNPLASRGGYARSKWFGCSCCPVNIARFMPQIPALAYASNEDVLYWNLFLEGHADLALDSGPVRVTQQTDYPWSGVSRLTVKPVIDGQLFTLDIRIPGWALGHPVPSDLYKQTVPGSLQDVSVKVNGKPVVIPYLAKGYCVIQRTWKSGDTVEVSFPMPVRRIRADERVKDDAGRLAVERGPVVYCAEGVDNGGSVFDAVLPAAAQFKDATVNIGGRTFPALDAGGLRLIPYFAWCNRGADEMQVWFHDAAAFPTRVAKWRGDAKGAFSLFYDDGCVSGWRFAVPALEKYAVPGTFYLCTGWFDKDPTALADWFAAARRFPSVIFLGNHTLTHCGVTNFAAGVREIGGNADALRKGLGLPPAALLSFARPGGVAWNATPAEEARLLAAAGCVERPHDRAAQEFHVASRTHTTAAQIVRLMDEAERSGSFETMMFHGVGGDWFRFSAGEHLKMVRELARRQAAGTLWTGATIEVQKYVAERDAAQVRSVRSVPGGFAVDLAVGTDPVRYDCPLTLVTVVPAGTDSLAVIQAGQTNHFPVCGTAAVYEVRPVTGPVEAQF